jgi:hypothetical protein
MKKLKNLFLGSVLLIVLALLLWVIISWFVGFFGNASDNVKATSITAIVSVSIFSLGRYIEGRREARQRINAEKIGVYKRFFEFYFDVFSYEKIHGKKMPDEKILGDMIGFQKEVVFWGSDQVIKDYLDFKDNLAAFSVNSAGAQNAQLAEFLVPVFHSTANLLSAMRRDIGYTFTSFSAHDLGRMQLLADDETKITLDLLRRNKKN